MTTKTYLSTFIIDGMDANTIMMRVENEIVDLRVDAAFDVMKAFRKHGHFNGDVDVEVIYFETPTKVEVRVTLRDYGLPLRHLKEGEDA